MQYAVLVASLLALVASSLSAPLGASTPAATSAASQGSPALAPDAASTASQGTSAPAPSAASIRKDINAFLELIPVHKMEEIIIDYLAGDDEVKAFVEFMRTDAFKNIVRKVDAIPEFRKMISFLEGAGLPAYKHVNAMHTMLGVESDFPPTPTVAGAPGIAGLVNAIREVLPMDKIVDLYMKSSEQLTGVVDKIRGDDLATDKVPDE